MMEEQPLAELKFAVRMKMVAQLQCGDARSTWGRHVGGVQEAVRGREDNLSRSTAEEIEIGELATYLCRVTIHWMPEWTSLRSGAITLVAMLTNTPLDRRR